MGRKPDITEFIKNFSLLQYRPCRLFIFYYSLLPHSNNLGHLTNRVLLTRLLRQVNTLNLLLLLRFPYWDSFTLKYRLVLQI